MSKAKIYQYNRCIQCTHCARSWFFRKKRCEYGMQGFGTPYSVRCTVFNKKEETK